MSVFVEEGEKEGEGEGEGEREREREREREGGEEGKKRKRELSFYHLHRLSEAVTPLLSTPYSEQLKMKEKAMSEFLKKMAKRISSKDSYPVKHAAHHLFV